MRAYFGSAEVLGTLVADGASNASEMRAPAAPARAGRRVSRAALRLAPPFADDAARRRIRRELPTRTDARAGGDDPDEEAVLAVLANAELERGRRRRDRVRGESARRRRVARRSSGSSSVADVVAVARPPAYVDARCRASFARARARAARGGASRRAVGDGLTSIALARDARCRGTAARARSRTLSSAKAGSCNRGGYYAASIISRRSRAEQRAFFDHLVPVDEVAAVPADTVCERRGGGQAFAAVRRAQSLRYDARARRIRQSRRAISIADRRSPRSGRASKTHLRERRRMTASQSFATSSGTSRKYAVPLLEWLDSHAVTVRERRLSNAAQGLTRADRPTGTVTFLFTDIEGSTRALGDAIPARWRRRSRATMR